MEQKGFGYFHQPVGLITGVTKKAEKLKVRGMLLIPDFCMLVERKIWKGEMTKLMKWRPNMICTVEILNDIFRNLKFYIKVVMFDFS